MDKLKEYIKQLAREVLDEESTSGDAGVYLTPNAFSPKGQKKNAATKAAEKQGMKVTKGMPKHSKMLDYKELWKGKKSSMNEYSNYDQASSYGAKSKYSDASGYTGPSSVTKGGGYYANAVKEIKIDKSAAKGKGGKKFIPKEFEFPSTLLEPLKFEEADDEYKKAEKEYNSKKNLKEELYKIIKEELLNEVTYSKFKNEVKFRTKNEMLHRGIREVKRKLNEVERLIEYVSRMKGELLEDNDGINYWKNTSKNINEIGETANRLCDKIKNLYE